jgi:exosortase
LTESSSTTSPNKISRARVVLAALVLLALWFVLCRQLSGEWSVNEQYSYGWFVPFFALFLFWLRWENRGQRAEDRERKSEDSERRTESKSRRRIVLAIGAAALLILLPVRLFEIGNPDWRPLDWVHASAVITITFVVLYLAGGWAWVKHFSFPVLFFFVAVPWISPIEQPVVQGLMRTVASVATEALSLCGIPAQLEGSLIRVSSGLVGVNEACSGVRSLQTSLMIGLLFGELKRLSVGRRIALVIGALAIAILANFGRAFFLVWVAATRGISAVAQWHDFAGYTIVAIVFCGSLALTAILNRNKVERRKEKGENEEMEKMPQRFLLSTSYFLLSLVWLFAVEIGTEFWYRAHERQMVSRISWTARWPEKAPAFREIHISEEVKSTLRFDEGREVAWKIPEPVSMAETKSPSALEQHPNCFLFFFRWHPGASTILRARAHRPDVCLPNVGWRQLADHGLRSYRATTNLALPFRHFSFVRDAAGQRAVFAHAFFCMREDKVNPTASTVFDPNEKTPTDWMPSDRWRVVREGLRNPGQQVMEFVLMSPQEISGEEAEAKFAALTPEMVEEK